MDDLDGSEVAVNMVGIEGTKVTDVCSPCIAEGGNGKEDVEDCGGFTVRDAAFELDSNGSVEEDNDDAQGVEFDEEVAVATGRSGGVNIDDWCVEFVAAFDDIGHILVWSLRQLVL